MAEILRNRFFLANDNKKYSRTMIFLQEELTSGVLGYLVIEYIIWIGTLIFVLLLIVALM